mmetsp:Transcript_25630/g.36135  ORF Transcript_25630/g.36135 Transcript_25630/m.36135 type:complete len:240 (-) Transcript_25630:1609-2328(-)
MLCLTWPRRTLLSVPSLPSRLLEVSPSFVPTRLVPSLKTLCLSLPSSPPMLATRTTSTTRPVSTLTSSATINSCLRELNIKRVRDARRSSLLVDLLMPTARRRCPLSTMVLIPRLSLPLMELPLKLPPMKKPPLNLLKILPLVNLHPLSTSPAPLPEVFCVVSVFSVTTVDVKEKSETPLKSLSSVLPTSVVSTSNPSRTTLLLLTKFLSVPNTSSWLLFTTLSLKSMEVVSMASTSFT